MQDLLLENMAIILCFCHIVVGVVLVVVTMLDAAEITASAEDGRRCAAAQCFVRGGAGVMVWWSWAGVKQSSCL